MEGVGARLGRSSTRYGPTTVFTGPVRKWKKKWVNVTPPNAPAATASGNSQHHHHQTSISSNGNSSSNSSNDNGAHILLYKWTPIKQSQNPAADNDSNVDAKDDGAAEDVDEEPPRRKIKYIPVSIQHFYWNSADCCSVIWLLGCIREFTRTRSVKLQNVKWFRLKNIRYYKPPQTASRKKCI